MSTVKKSLHKPNLDRSSYAFKARLGIRLYGLRVRALAVRLRTSALHRSKTHL